MLSVKGRIEPSLNQLKKYNKKIDSEIIKLVKFFDSNLNKDWKIYVDRNLNNCFHVDIILFHRDYGIKFLFVDHLFNDKNITKVKQESVSIKSKYSIYKRKSLLLDNKIIDNNFLYKFSDCKKFLSKLGIEKKPIGSDLFDSIIFLKNVTNSNQIPLMNIPSKIFTNDIYKVDKNTLLKYLQTDQVKLNLSSIKERKEERFKKNFDIIKGRVTDNSNHVHAQYLPKKCDKKNITEDDFKYATLESIKFCKDHYKTIYPILKPSFHRIEAAQKISLSNKQKRYSKVYQNTHQRLSGVAGSGKSLVAVTRAGNSAAAGKRTLIVVFNKSIKNYLRSQLNRKVRNEWFDSFITIDHFHGVLKTIKSNIPAFNEDNYVQNSDGTYTLNRKDEENSDDKSYDFKVRYPNQVLSMLNKYPIDDLFDTIIIDEGQDFHYSWYKILSKILSKNGDLLLLADNNQNIYKNKLEWMSDKKYKTKFSGEWGKLEESRRVKNKSIINVSNTLIDMLDDLDKEKIKFYSKDQKEFRFDKPYINWIDSKFNKIPAIQNSNSNSTNKTCRDCGKHLDDNEHAHREKTLNKCKYCYEIFNECKSHILETYNTMKDKYNMNDITVLVPFQDELTDIFDFFHKNKVECTATIDKKMNHKLSFLDKSKDYKNEFALNNNNDMVKISTIHSYKGLSAPNVIILTYPTFATDISSDNLIYTAITRTEESLVTINRNSKYANIGKQVMKQFKAA